MSSQPSPTAPAGFDGYAPLPGYPGQQAPAMPPQGYLQSHSGPMYPFPTPPPQLSLTGQLRASEADELPSHYRLRSSRPRWLTYVVAGVLAIALAATATFFVIRGLTPETKRQWGSVYVSSVPAGADVLFDGTLLPEKTPLTIDQAKLGARHMIRVALAHYEPYEESVQIPPDGHEVAVAAKLSAISGKLVVESTPPNAEIRINNEVRGRTPMIISDVDRDSAKLVVELRLKDYQPFIKDLTGATWPADNKLKVSAKLVR